MESYLENSTRNGTITRVVRLISGQIEFRRWDLPPPARMLPPLEAPMPPPIWVSLCLGWSQWKGWRQIRPSLGDGSEGQERAPLSQVVVEVSEVELDPDMSA